MAVKCMECMDAGFRMFDGTPSACPACDAGAAFEQTGRSARSMATIPRSELIPRNLPPGGDVIVTEMKRQAAKLPVGVIGSDVLVRAQVEAQPMVHDLVRLIDDFARDTPGTVERAVDYLKELPVWAIPDDVREREPLESTEPMLPPPGQDQLPTAPVVPLKGARPARPSQPPTAAPLEPPED